MLICLPACPLALTPAACLPAARRRRNAPEVPPELEGVEAVLG
jgi:hypothetical protein